MSSETTAMATTTTATTNTAPDHLNKLQLARSVYRGPFEPSKIVFYIFHTIAVAITIWFVIGGGLDTMGLPILVPFRVYAMLGASVLYWLRHGITLFVILKRSVPWEEAFTLIFFFLLLHPGYCILATGNVWPKLVLNVADYIGIGLIVIGSYLGSASELDRMLWKKNPANKGKCYTGGLWKYAMHINYFGDIVLFTGWTMLTGCFWMCWLPLGMAYNFAGPQSRELDEYLAKRYGTEFLDYQRKTKKLIPFIY